MRAHHTISLLGILFSGCVTTEQTDLAPLSSSAEVAQVAGDDDDTLSWNAGPRVPL